MKRRQLAGSALVAIAAMIVSAGTAGAVDGNLPGGTAISVTITSPAEDTVFPQGPVTVNGTASIGMGVPVRDTALTYVVDVSGSTVSPCDGTRTVLQCEIVASTTLNAIAAGPTSVIGTVGAVMFGSNAATLDVQPAAGDQLLTGPGTNQNGNGTRDVEEVINSLSQGSVSVFTAKTVGTGTFFPDAVTTATTVTNAQSEARKIVVFLSDGFSIGDVRPAANAAPANVDYFTFAVGSGSACNSGDYNASLQAIADITGGTCTQVPDPANLPSVLPGVIQSRLTSLTASVDSGGSVPVTNVTPGLPQTGPASVNWTFTTGHLTSGRHEICVTAHGVDGGGTGSVTDCTHVIINDPPQVDPGGPYAGQEGTPVSIAGIVTDPDGPTLTTKWASSPASGVDPGASCVFGNADVLATTVTCTDDGVWTLRLTANDSLHPDVVATTTLTLTNVAPQVSISSPANGSLVLRGVSVPVTAPFTDISTNDRHTCTVDFDDGSPVATGTVAQGTGFGTCTAAHTYTGVGAHQVLVTVRDDDGGAATAVVTVVSYVRAEAWALSATGLITVAKTPHATCPPNTNLTTATITVPGLASVQALHAECTLNPGTGRTDASARVDGASLLGGLISLTNLETNCVANEQGLSGSSRVGTLNGQPIGTQPATITIPLVATVHLNQSVVGPNGQFARYAVRVVTLLGQEIILGGCRLGI